MAIQTAYQNVHGAYRNFSSLAQTDSEFRPSQKTLFSSLSAMFPPLGLASVPTLEKDVYYYQAQLVDQEKTFQGHPGSLNRLRRPAKNYCLIFDQVLSLLKSPKPPLDLKEKLEQLGNAHLQFANAFVPELKKVAHETSPIVCLNYPQTLTLFLGAVFPDIQKLKQRIIDKDSEIVTMIPNLAIVEMLSSGCKETPEIFRPHTAVLYKKSMAYRDLSLQEKVNLRLKLIGEDVPLQPFTLELFKSINAISSTLTRGETNLIFKETFKELEKAISLLETLPKGPFETGSQAAKALIRSYLSNPTLSEKDLPDALFDEKYRLPIRAMKASSTEENIENLSDLIAEEPKAKPWLQLIMSS